MVNSRCKEFTQRRSSNGIRRFSVKDLRNGDKSRRKTE